MSIFDQKFDLLHELASHDNFLDTSTVEYNAGINLLITILEEKHRKYKDTEPNKYACLDVLRNGLVHDVSGIPPAHIKEFIDKELESLKKDEGIPLKNLKQYKCYQLARGTQSEGKAFFRKMERNGENKELAIQECYGELIRNIGAIQSGYIKFDENGNRKDLKVFLEQNPTHLIAAKNIIMQSYEVATQLTKAKTKDPFAYKIIDELNSVRNEIAHAEFTKKVKVTRIKECLLWLSANMDKIQEKYNLLVVPKADAVKINENSQALEIPLSKDVITGLKSLEEEKPIVAREETRRLPVHERILSERQLNPPSSATVPQSFVSKLEKESIAKKVLRNRK